MRPRISIRGCARPSVRPSVGRSVPRFYLFRLSQLRVTLGNSEQLWTTLGQFWTTLGRIFGSTLGLVLINIFDSLFSLIKKISSCDIEHRSTKMSKKNNDFHHFEGTFFKCLCDLSDN